MGWQTGEAKDNPDIIIDGAHNEASAKVLLDARKNIIVITLNIAHRYTR